MVFKKIYSITLALLILLSTTGVMLINSYCSCSGTSETAIYFEFDTDCCEDLTSVSTKTCCGSSEQNLKLCCENHKKDDAHCAFKHESNPAEKECCNTTTDKDHDCDSSTHEYKKLEVDLLMSSQLQIIPSIVMLNLLVVDLFDQTIEDELNFILRRVDSSPPHKLLGKQVLILHKQLKIASFS